MEFRLLGPFEARVDGRRITVGNRRQERLLLAILLLEAGRLVSVDRLIDLLWDGDNPGSARASVHTYVGRLRRALHGQDVSVVTGRDGYLVEPDGHRLDTDEFADLTGRAAEASDPQERVELYDRALALWRGPLLAGEPAAERLGTGWHERWLSAQRRRAGDRLTMGLAERVVSDLTPAVDRYPAEEPLVVLLMTALHREGRTAEALRRYDMAAKVLEADLGVSPGEELRTVRRRILRSDPRLDRPTAPVFTVRVRDQWLPWAVGGHPALEFCNTFAGWGGPPLPGSEWLRGYPALAAWAQHMDLADEPTVSRLLRTARRAPRAAEDVLAEARKLRTALYACLTTPGDDGAFRVVASYAQEAARSAVLTHADGLARWTLPPSTGLRLPLLAAARAGADLLADPRRHGVRACPGPHCGWLFLDASGRRRYCSASICGRC